MKCRDCLHLVVMRDSRSAYNTTEEATAHYIGCAALEIQISLVETQYYIFKTY